MDTPETKTPSPRRRREAKVAGIRLVGIFVPWQAVALTLAVVIGLTAALTLRSEDPTTVRVEQASSDGILTETTSTSVPPEVSTTTVALSTTTTETTALATTTTTPTTVPPAPTTTTTKLPPGASEVGILAGGSRYMNGQCTVPAADWSNVAGCPDSPRSELDFTHEAGRYPAGSRHWFDAHVGVATDTTYCLRLYDVDRAQALPGSERCWTPPVYSTGADADISEQVGPVTFPPGRSRYTVQARVLQASTGAGCFSANGRSGAPCTGYLYGAKVLIEWG